jgi:hypothetical protein
MGIIVSHLLLAFFLLFATVAASADEWGLTTRDQRIDETLHALAGLPSLQERDVDQVLHAIGFQHGLDQSTWQGMSAKAKFSMGYRSALAVSPKNGRDFLAAAAHDLAQHYESLHFDSLFRSFLSEAPPGRVAYASPLPASTLNQIAPEERMMLATLSDYISGPGPLGRFSIASHYFDLHGAALDSALAERNPEKFLHAAAARAYIPPTVSERINHLMSAVMREAESARFDPALQKVAQTLEGKFGKRRSEVPIALAPHADTPDIPPSGLRNPGDPGPSLPSSPSRDAPVGPSATSSEARLQRAVESHSQFEARANARVTGRTFSKIMMRAGGAGGVLTGAEVASSLAKPLSISTAFNGSCDGSGSQVGSLTVITSAGTYAMNSIPCDILSASRRIVFEPPAGTHAWTPQEGTVLASIDTQGLVHVFPLYLPPGGDLARLGNRWHMILHPALVDLDIGRATAFLDLWPTAMNALIRLTGENAEVQSWLRQVGKNSTWKWSDSPSRIAAVEGVLMVKPLGRRTMLSQRFFSEEQLELEFGIEQSCESSSTANSCRQAQSALDRWASKQAPGAAEASDKALFQLTRHVPEVARVEQFLRVLAVFRWAKQEGAILNGAPIQLARTRARTPETVIVGLRNDYLTGEAVAPAWSSACELLVKQLKSQSSVKTAEQTVDMPLMVARNAALQTLVNLNILNLESKTVNCQAKK